MGWLRDLRERRSARILASQTDEVFEDIFGVPNVEHVRKWPREKLHRHLAENKLSKEQRIAAESELRRREAWEAPAGKAFWISISALGLSIVSLAFSVFGGS